MELPQELEVWYVIPGIRRELATAMKNKGMKQVEIARRLGVTKSAVTQYLNKTRGSEVKFNNKIKQEITLSAQRINNTKDILREMQYLLGITREEKIACQVHRNMEEGFETCNVCFEQPLIQIRK